MKISIFLLKIDKLINVNWIFPLCIWEEFVCVCQDLYV